MQKTTTIYGQSDDCIELEGAISDEFYPDHDDMGFLHFACGTVVKAEYNKDGNWIIAPMHLGAGVMVVKPERIPESGSDDEYTGRLELSGLKKPVFCFGSPDGPSRAWLEDYFNDKFDPSDVKVAILEQAFRLVTQGTLHG